MTRHVQLDGVLLKDTGGRAFQLSGIFYQEDATTSGPVSVALTGQAAAFAAGTLIPSSASTTVQQLTGQAAAFAAGTLTPVKGASLIGQAMALAAGLMQPTEENYFYAGVAVPEIDIALTGFAMSAVSGVFVVEVDGAIQAPLVGQSMAGSAGAVGIDAGVNVVGLGMRLDTGSFSNVEVALEGQAIMFQAGAFTFPLGVWIDVPLDASTVWTNE